MYSNRCFIFCRLFDDYNSQVSHYFHDLAASIKQELKNELVCRLYCAYPEHFLKKQLSSIAPVRMIDPLLQNTNDFASMFNEENGSATVHLIFTRKAYCNSLAGSSQSFTKFLQQSKHLISNEQIEQGSPLALAKQIGAKIILCLDANQFNQQTHFLLNKLLTNSEDNDVIAAFAIYNGQAEQFEIWRNYLRQKYNKECCWHNQKFCAGDYFKTLLRQANGKEFNFDERLLQLSSKIYKRLATYGLTNTKLRVALAYDEAFSAYDPYELQFLSQLGIEWYKFSPLKDKFLPVNCLAYYFAASNLHFYLGQLTANNLLLNQLRKAAHAGSLFIAQDQAHLYLLEGVYDFMGNYHPQLGFIPQKARILDKNSTYTYAQVSALNDNCFAPQNSPTLAFLNQSVELQPKLGGLRCSITASFDQQQRHLNSGYCDAQFFSSLNRFWPSTNYDWLEHFYSNLILRFLKSKN